MDNRKDLLTMVRKFLGGRETPEERAFLESYYRFLERDNDILNQLDPAERALLEERMEAGISAILDGEHRAEAPVRRLWPRIAAAASIILALGTGAYFLMHKEQKPEVAMQQVKPDILPGTNAATLTLSDGKQIALNKSMKGELAVQGQTSVQMKAGGTVTYNGERSNANVELVYNTLTTKRKQQFPLVFSDGTEVMLDAESSITYPVAFTGHERKVKITGQAYFKVAHNPGKPFSVEVKGQTVRDIGTEFNINAYDDEPVVKTTLVEGAVSVGYKGTSKLLKPGQAAVLNGESLLVQPGELDEATAWRNNLFHFSGADLKTVMRQFARWYDVDVTYEGNIPHFDFGGDVSRNVKASEIFEVLGRYGLKVRLEGKNVIISAK